MSIFWFDRGAFHYDAGNGGFLPAGGDGSEIGGSLISRHLRIRPDAIQEDWAGIEEEAHVRLRSNMLFHLAARN